MHIAHKVACRDALVDELVTEAQRHCHLQHSDVRLAASVLAKRRGIILCLSGAAGSGKSTLASLLGQRLGIVNVLSTDSIRHTMRYAALSHC
jgi:2-phosphoglycerate kinase